MNANYRWFKYFKNLILVAVVLVGGASVNSKLKKQEKTLYTHWNYMSSIFEVESILTEFILILCYFLVVVVVVCV